MALALYVDLPVLFSTSPHLHFSIQWSGWIVQQYNSNSGACIFTLSSTRLTLTCEPLNHHSGHGSLRQRALHHPQTILDDCLLHLHRPIRTSAVLCSSPFHASWILDIQSSGVHQYPCSRVSFTSTSRIRRSCSGTDWNKFKQVLYRCAMVPCSPQSYVNVLRLSLCFIRLASVQCQRYVVVLPGHRLHLAEVGA